MPLGLEAHLRLLAGLERVHLFVEVGGVLDGPSRLDRIAHHIGRAMERRAGELVADLAQGVIPRGRVLERRAGLVQTGGGDIRGLVEPLAGSLRHF